MCFELLLTCNFIVFVLPEHEFHMLSNALNAISLFLKYQRMNLMCFEVLLKCHFIVFVMPEHDLEVF